MGQWRTVLTYALSYKPSMNVYWAGVFYIQNLNYGMQFEKQHNMFILIATSVATEYAFFMWLWTGIICSQELNYDTFLKSNNDTSNHLTAEFRCCVAFSLQPGFLILWISSYGTAEVWLSRKPLWFIWRNEGYNECMITGIKMKISTVTPSQNVFQASGNVHHWERIM
jgi:hypothetical protein